MRRFPRLPRAARLPIILLLGTLSLIAAGILLNRAVSDLLLRRDAEMTAQRWAEDLAARLPDLPAVLAGLPAAPETAALLDRARDLGGVFRFSLFDPEGRLVFHSERLVGTDGAAGPAGAETLAQRHGGGPPIAARLLAGAMHVEAARGQPPYPPFFTKAYVPVRPDGARLGGVAEVHLDQSERQALYRHAFQVVEIGVAGILLLAALVLGLIDWRRTKARQAAEARLRHLACHDPLTGLPNRARLQDRLAEALAQSSRSAGVAVLVLDLDRFGDVNDTLGQAAGDALLLQVAHRLCGAVRHQDIVARLGADRFVVVQVGLLGAAGAVRLAERLAERLREPWVIGGQPWGGSATIGLAIGPRDGAEPALLLRRAELALAHAKQEARGGWRGFRPGMDADLLARRRLEAALRAAIEAESLVLRYQPLHALPGRERIGYEALLRWSHPDHGAVSPSVFIPLAEDTGLIEPLGAWVLRRACREAAAWPAPMRVAINLSPAQFRQGDIVGTVREALRESGLAPARLELEITEGLLLHNTDQVLRQLAALRRLGVGIVMDDFGTGYSSLGYLWRFPFDKLKIDRSFVRDLETDEKAAAIVGTIIGLGRALHIPVTAEGVETEAQMRALAEAGCDQVQGFLLGRPAPPEALAMEAPPLPSGCAPRLVAAE